MNGKDILDAIVTAYEDGSPAALITVVDGDLSEKIVVCANAPPAADIGGWRREADRLARELLVSRKETALVSIKTSEGRELKLAIEKMRSRISLFVFGAGHVGQAVALIGGLLGYQVTVIDDRPEFLTRERFPNPRIDLATVSFEEAPSKIRITANSAVVIVTRGHQYDEECLMHVVDSPAQYIGMIGSRRRVIAVYDRLARRGVRRESLDRVHAPIGLKIGARSPQEIAVAILAEIVQTMNLDRGPKER